MLLQLFNQVAHRGFCHVSQGGTLHVGGWHAYQSTFPSDQLVIVVGVRGPTNHMERWYNTLHQRLGQLYSHRIRFENEAGSARFFSCFGNPILPGDSLMTED